MTPVMAVKAEVPFPCRMPVSVPAPDPPPGTVSVPDCDGVKVRVSPEPVIVITDVMPFVALVEVASVVVGPSDVCPVGPIAVIAELAAGGLLMRASATLEDAASAKAIAAASDFPTIEEKRDIRYFSVTVVDAADVAAMQ